MDTLKISATANGLNYLPEYVATVGSIFTDRGLAVTAKACDPWTGVLDDIESGEADLALGGLWVPALYAGAPRKLSVVGQLNHAFPMAIVSRTETSPITLDQLAGKVVLSPGAGGSAPYEFTAGLIREAGLSPADTSWMRDLSTSMMIELYKAGTGDAIVLDLVSANEVVADGFGTIVFRHLSAGLMPNSVYYTESHRVADLGDRVERFMDGIAEAMVAITSGSVDAEIDAVLAERWPTKDHGLLREAIAEMIAGNVWGSATIDRDASDRWMRILHEVGLTTHQPSLEELLGEQPVSVSA
ncbi:ABC transporter substrate-binding protein [Frondihabitans australicus]|uniref:NitT/TauT family transport system substrate-binding protein n=1 Tax=Frondihabitans australicus TaxID=386892 RepID=A0A495IH47_9MICO|nr:ABC transporter substrate-binding protein [Frondihabitans australicus]RKR74768.1 NitT/TauT family transport system substrate-binding protein [Frondihabitans australicus]